MKCWLIWNTKNIGTYTNKEIAISYFWMVIPVISKWEAIIKIKLINKIVLKLQQFYIL